MGLVCANLSGRSGSVNEDERNIRGSLRPKR